MCSKKKYAVFTMDVEDFSDAGCLARRGLSPDDDMLDGIDKYVSLLERHGIRATLFTLCHTAKRIEEKLASISERGHAIALHGYDHTSLDKLTAEEFREKTKKAKEYLEGILGKRVEGYRAPFFSMDDEKIEVLRSLGFKYDSSSHGFTRNYLKGGFSLEGFENRLSGVYSKDGLYEFSLSCENILGCTYPVSGGGYVRLCPWPLVRDGIKRYIKKNDCYVFYLHPFELSDNRSDAVAELPRSERFYLSSGISAYAEKIERIIEMLKREGYTFVTFDELCDEVEKEEKTAALQVK